MVHGNDFPRLRVATNIEHGYGSFEAVRDNDSQQRLNSYFQDVAPHSANRHHFVYIGNNRHSPNAGITLDVRERLLNRIQDFPDLAVNAPDEVQVAPAA